jgi:glycosyltransferase involved in cell wall biosynthesis
LPRKAYLARLNTNQEGWYNLMRLTIVHTSSILNLRGSERWLLDVISLMRTFSVELQVISFDSDKKYANSVEEVSRRNREIAEVMKDTPFVRLSARRLSLPLRVTPFGKETTRTLNRYLNSVPFGSRLLASLRSSDVIYFMQVNRRPIQLLTVLALATLAGRKRVVVGIHVNPEYTRIQVGVLRLFVRMGILRGVHVVNQPQQDQIGSVLGCKTYYVPNGIFSEKFAVSKTGNERHEFSVLFVGAMTHVKGADLLPLIDDDLRKRGIPFRLLICTSGGPLTEAIEAWGRSRPEVSFMGYLEQDELLSVYGSASVAVFPSRREIFGLACIEAQASGTPVVVSQADGFRQTVVEGYSGYFAPRFDPASFSDGLMRVFNMWSNERTLYDAFCEHARKNASERFQWRNIIREFVQIINDAGGVPNFSEQPSG